MDGWALESTSVRMCPSSQGEIEFVKEEMWLGLGRGGYHMETWEL